MAEHEEHIPLLHLSRDVSAFGKRARAAAITLYTISYTCSLLPGAQEPQIDVAGGLFAIAGTALCLSDRLTALFSSPSPEYNLQDLEHVEKFFATCEPIYIKIDAAVEVADGYVCPGSTLPYEKGIHRTGAFTRDEAVEAQHMLWDCLHAFSKLSMVARVNVLRQRAELNDDETLESLRLNAALTQNDSRDSIQTNLQLPNHVPIRAFDQISAHNNSSTTLDMVRQKIENATIGKLNEDEAASLEKDKQPVLETPASTRAGTPEATAVEAAPAHSAPKNPQDEANPENVQNCAPKAKPGMGSNEQAASATSSKSVTAVIERPHPPTPFRSLEAFVLRPVMTSYQNFISCSTEIVRLDLDNEAMSAHMVKLDAHHSIIDALSGLLPDQIRTIQTHAEQRRGKIVSVKHGSPVSMSSQMGSFQVKPVIFILELIPNINREKPAIPHCFAEKKKPVFGGFGTAAPGFANPLLKPNANPFQTNGPLGPDRFFAPPPPPPPPQKIVSPFSTQQYPTKDRGKDVFFVEKDELGERQYMTITMNTECSCADNSLEEMRLKDYKAGRTAPPVEEEKPFGGQYTNPRASSGSPFGVVPKPSPFSGGLFNGFRPQTNNYTGLFGQTPLPGQPLPQDGLFGRPAPTSGLFGNQAPGLFGSAPQQRSSTSVFGQPVVCGPQFSCWRAPQKPDGDSSRQTTSGLNTGLFGQAPTSSSGNLFGQQTNNPTTGLFGQPIDRPSSTSLFGAPPSTSSSSPFRASTSAPSTSLFGAQHPVSSVSSFGNPAIVSGNTSLFAATPATAPVPAQGLFGRPVHSAPASPQASSTPQSSSNPMPTIASTSTEATQSRPTSYFAQRPHAYCKQCSSSLTFHQAAESSANLCDACKGNKETQCRLCQHRMEIEEVAKTLKETPSSTASAMKGEKEVDDDQPL